MMSTSTSAGSVMAAASTAVMMTPLAGIRFELTLDHSWWPGTARSRLKANSMREALVWQAVVQKNWPAVEISRMIATHWESMAWMKMLTTAPPPAVTPSTSWTANRNVSRRIQPPIAE